MHLRVSHRRQETRRNSLHKRDAPASGARDHALVRFEVAHCGFCEVVLNLKGSQRVAGGRVPARRDRNAETTTISPRPG